ncbi:IS481 family transposase, partial [Jatrophihabitans endophyticus]|uniref:IS481 family transposase n=1 Tax=Jatrophihabitans endophyticus TaxID=1206085 RepID=UPI0026F20CF0
MSMARVVITAVVLEGRSKSEVARDYGVSRRWVQTLVARYAAEGEAAFEPRSRRPHTSPTRHGRDVEDAVVALRKQLCDQGLDAGADTIAWHLRQASGPDQPVPSSATIWRMLARRGFITPQPHKRPRSSWHRFQADLPNECWQADITHWPLGDGTEAEILHVIDDHSRLLVGATARTVFKAGDVVLDLHAAMAHHGRPERMLTDNGAVFTGNYRGRGWVALERELTALGIGLGHSKPYHPQTCGKVERLHQTVKKWLARQPAAATVAELQTQLDTFVEYYNHHRPHRAIARRTPAQAWHARTRAVPTRQGIRIDTHYRVRADRVDRDGKLTLRHGSRLHHIGIGRDHAGTPILMLVHEL